MGVSHRIAAAGRRLSGGLQSAAGGPDRLRAIVLLSAVLAFAGADQTVIGAVAPGLKQALDVDNTHTGLLVSATGLAAALAILPFGVLADRTRRTTLLVIGLGICFVSVAIAGASGSFLVLLIAMIALGIGVGTVNPAIASLTGDLFPAASRGQVYGYILAGEIGGSAVGLLLSVEVAAWWTWRASFWVLALPSLALAVVIWRVLPEPARGGQGRLPIRGREQRHTVEDSGDADGELPAVISEHSVQPKESRVLRADPTGRSLWWAVRYVLSIPTNVVLIVASALGYFFFAGLQTFAVVYLRSRFGVGQGVTGLLLVGIGSGALLGILSSGRLADWLIDRRHLAARPVVSGIAFLLAAGLFLPALMTTSLAVAFPLLFFAAAAIGGMNPPLDAARLDIMHSRLWGRAESVRSFLQALLKSTAPVLLGFLSEVFGGAAASGSGSAAAQVAQNPATGEGLARALLLMLVPLAMAGVLLVTVGRRHYPTDVATAMASERAVSAGDGGERG